LYRSLQISIIIPVKNGSKTIAQCLNAIIAQTLFGICEVIIIDSGSTDNTLEILSKYSFVKLYQIPPVEFGHGKTRNYGVSLAKGEFVVMTVQDAWAADNLWLEKMIQHFADEKVCAVVGQQVVPHHSDKNPHQWWRPVSQPRLIETYFENPSDFLNLTGKEQDNVCFYDDVNTMYRKSALLETPFDDIEYGEDMIIAKKFLSTRKKIIYDARSSVWHYHFQHKDYVYRSTITNLYYKYLIFNYVVNYQWSIVDFLKIIYRNVKYKAEFKWILHNFNIIFYRQKAYYKFVSAAKKSKLDIDKMYKRVNPSVVQGRL